MANFPFIFSGKITQFLWISPGGEIKNGPSQALKFLARKSLSEIEIIARRIKSQPSKAENETYILPSINTARGSSDPPQPPPEGKFQTLFGRGPRNEEVGE